MDHGDAVFDRKVLERLSHRCSNQIGMVGVAADYEPESDDTIDIFALHQCRHSDGNFKGTGNPDKIDTGQRNEFAEFFDRVFDERIGELFIVFGSDNTDSGLVADDPWFWLQRGRHVLAMEGSGKNVNWQGATNGL